jgi:hypothetical protein
MMHNCEKDSREMDKRQSVRTQLSASENRYVYGEAQERAKNVAHFERFAHLRIITLKTRVKVLQDAQESAPFSESGRKAVRRDDGL